MSLGKALERPGGMCLVRHWGSNQPFSQIKLVENFLGKLWALTARNNRFTHTDRVMSLTSTRVLRRMCHAEAIVCITYTHTHVAPPSSTTHHPFRLLSRPFFFFPSSTSCLCHSGNLFCFVIPIWTFFFSLPIFLPATFPVNLAHGAIVKVKFPGSDVISLAQVQRVNVLSTAGTPDCTSGRMPTLVRMRMTAATCSRPVS